MGFAYAEKIARINLTTGEIKAEKLYVELAKKFVGGRGLGTKIVYDEGCATADPLGPDNKLVYATGPLTGAGVPSSSRYMVITKSPLTGMIACSNSGGIWGAKLKYAGWDALIVEGEAPEWTYINIVDDKIELLDAREYLGLFSSELDDRLKEKHGKDASVLSIGIAGEKRVLLASVMNDKDRSAGRSGVGAVMGSKKLKSIVVTASKRNSDEYMASTEAVKEANTAAMGKIRENALTGGGLKALGTASLVNVINSVGGLPTKNWQEAYYDKAEDVSGEALAEKFLVRAAACHRCPIVCGRVVKVDGKEVGGPEYEPLWAYGADVCNNDLAAVNECNLLCNEYGLDAISAPCTIAAAMELYQRGAIKEADCAGVPLEWGSTEALKEWTKRMGDPQTELDWLMSSGSARLCEHYGMPEVSMSVKKQEMPAYDARAIQGVGITYATSNRGGCHVRGYTIAPEVVGLPVQIDRTVTNEKAFWSKTFQDLTAVIDSLGLCLFTSFALGAPEYTQLLNAACGTNYSPEEVMEIGERIYNIERMFNKAAGMRPEEDRLPKRMLSEPIPTGPSKGLVSKLDVTLPEYYEVRGWKNAFPTDETLKRLGLDECVGK
jgi:aldehyde:ferredoxin oxidoreductase